jgi:hypothetical protein
VTAEVTDARTAPASVLALASAFGLGSVLVLAFAFVPSAVLESLVASFPTF